MSDVDVRALFALYGGAHGVWAPFMIAVTIAGGGWGSLALLPMFFHARARPFAAALAAAIMLQAVLVWGMKLAVGRVRPWIALGLPPPLGAPHDGSFPSGHAAGSFCVAGFLAVVLPVVWSKTPGRARWVTGGAVTAAALVALSRVYLGAHFVSDVVCGGALGAIVGAVTGALFLRGRIQNLARRDPVLWVVRSGSPHGGIPRWRSRAGSASLK
jgi:undecaprenyl-diphosphatase